MSGGGISNLFINWVPWIRINDNNSSPPSAGQISYLKNDQGPIKRSHPALIGSRSQSRSLCSCISLCQGTWPCLSFSLGSVEWWTSFLSLNCYSKRRGRIADFFFLFLQKRDMAHFNIPIIYVPVHKSSIWKGPMVSRWGQALSNATLTDHSVPGAPFLYVEWQCIYLLPLDLP